MAEVGVLGAWQKPKNPAGFMSKFQVLRAKASHRMFVPRMGQTSEALD